MNGQNIGYIRCSTIEQNEDRQLRDMIDANMLDRVFIDKASGKNTNRPQLQECLSYLRCGDHLYCDSSDRLCRSVSDMSRLVNELTEKGVTIHFHKENLVFTPDKEDPMNTFVLNIITSVAQLELSLIHERQREGIAQARLRNAYDKCGRKPKFNETTKNDIKQKVANGQSISSLAREYKVSRTTIYSYLK